MIFDFGPGSYYQSILSSVPRTFVLLAVIMATVWVGSAGVSSSGLSANPLRTFSAVLAKRRSSKCLFEGGGSIGRSEREYPKAWGNCVLVMMLAGIVDGFCTRNLPA